MIQTRPFAVARLGRGAAPRRRHPSPRARLSPGLLAALMLAGVGWGAAAQEKAPAEAPAESASQSVPPQSVPPQSVPAESAPEAPRDLRPPAAAYAVVDARAIEAPLAGAVGDAGRGEAIFLSDLTGGCVSCHAAPGALRRNVVPRILRDRLPPMPLIDPAAGGGQDATDEDGSGDGAGDAETGAAAAEDAAAAAEGLSTSTSRLAPRRGPPPPERPAHDGVATGLEQGSGDGDPEMASEDAQLDSGEADAEAALSRSRARRAAERDAPPLLPVPMGPDLSGVAARLNVGELRLAVVNPQIGRPGSRMPAYHHISLALADRAPGLRQPWLSAQEVEDVVAYLATLTAPGAAPSAPKAATGEAPATGAGTGPDTSK